MFIAVSFLSPLDSIIIFSSWRSWAPCLLKGLGALTQSYTCLCVPKDAIHIHSHANKPSVPKSPSVLPLAWLPFSFSSLASHTRFLSGGSFLVKNTTAPTRILSVRKVTETAFQREVPGKKDSDTGPKPDQKHTLSKPTHPWSQTSPPYSLPVLITSNADLG